MRFPIKLGLIGATLLALLAWPLAAQQISIDRPGVQEIIAGTNVTVDATDPSAPIVSATGGGGGDVTNPLDANLDVGGFAVIGADDAVGGTDGGPVNIKAGDGTTGAGGGVDIRGGIGATYGGGFVLTGGDGGIDGGQLDIAGGQGAVNGGGIEAAGGVGVAGDGGKVEFAGGGGEVNGGPAQFFGGQGNTGNGGLITFTPGSGAVDGGDLSIALPPPGSGRQGLVIISGLPSSDPGVSGALYMTCVVECTLMISP